MKFIAQILIDNKSAFVRGLIVDYTGGVTHKRPEMPSFVDFPPGY